jgi:two-component system phosphate regulon sensor histidine kinase PhoR
MFDWTRRSFLRRLILSSALIAAVTAGLVGVVASRIARDHLTQEVASKLRAQGALLAPSVPLEAVRSGDTGRLDGIADRLGDSTGARVTITHLDGAVLGDSEVESEGLGGVENHAKRQEIRGALETGFGTSVRRSATLGLDFLYAAMPLEEDGERVGTLRLALPLSDVQAKVTALVRAIALWALLCLVCAVVLSVFVSRSVHRPLRAIAAMAERIASGEDVGRRKEWSDDEIGRIGSALESLSQRVGETIAALSSEKAQLRKMEEVRKVFVANVSHELRTPLAAIKGYSETLKRGGIDDRENRMEFIDAIERHSDRLTILVDDLLELASIESGSVNMELEQIPIAEFADEVWRALAPLAKKKNLDFVNSADPELRVSFDRRAMSQVLQNLFSNAVKYNREGGRVEFETEAAAETVKLRVRDSGIGIPASDLPRVFERFYRVDKARSREMGGTGLGLSIVKHLVENHGGRVSALSPEGEGTTIQFAIPA